MIQEIPVKKISGHIKNLNNFESLIVHCEDFGSLYCPANESIILHALKQKKADTDYAIKILDIAKIAVNHTTNKRETTFERFRRLAPRVLATMQASGVPQEILNYAKTIARKIQGNRKSKNDSTNWDQKIIERTTIDSSTIAAHCTGQQSYDLMIDHLGVLIQFLESMETYQPNETDLQITSLTKLYEAIRAANQEVAAALTAYKAALFERNVIMYDPKTGLVARAFEVKHYIKSVFGGNSQQFLTINKIRFAHIRF